QQLPAAGVRRRARLARLAMRSNLDRRDRVAANRRGRMPEIPKRPLVGGVGDALRLIVELEFDVEHGRGVYRPLVTSNVRRTIPVNWRFFLRCSRNGLTEILVSFQVPA